MRRDPTLTCREFPGLGRLYFQRAAGAETRFIHREIVLDGDYLKHGLTIGPGDVVFDVGANIGIFSLDINRRCSGRCTLYAFEPIPGTYRILERNMAEHGLSGRPDVRLFNLGLTRRDGPRTTEFAYYARLPGHSTSDTRQLTRKLDLYLSGQRRRRPRLVRLIEPLLRGLVGRYYRPQVVRCEMTTLSEICARHPVPRIDLLKIDVEGAEWDVLNGIEDADWPRISQIVIEAHDVDGRVAAITSLLRDRGYQVVSEQPSWARSAALDNFNLYARRTP